MATSTIIGDDKLPMIQQALADLDTAENELELARRAGLLALPQAAQLGDLAQKIATARQTLMQIKAVYFPNS